MQQGVSRREVVNQVYKQLGKSEQAEYVVDWLQDAWDSRDLLVEQFGEEQARKMVEAEKEERKIFREIREQHDITLEHLLGDVDGSISSEAIRYFDRTGKGTYFVIDACLDSLSAIAGEEYTRENVGGLMELPFLGKTREAEPEQTGP